MEFIKKIFGFFRKPWKTEAVFEAPKSKAFSGKEESTEKIDMSVNRKAISDHAQKPVVFDRIVELANGGKQEIKTEGEFKEESIIEEPAETVKEDRIIVPSTKGNVNFVNIDIKKLELVRVEREAETIIAYSKLLVKNIAHFRDSKEHTDIEGVVKKFKMIFIHSMELKNLLSSINEGFFEYLLANLENEGLKKELEEGKKKSDEIEALLMKMGLYDELFNPEKSADYKKNIEEAVHKGEFIKELEQLEKLLVNNINDKKNGIAINIDKAVAKLREIKR